MDTELGTSSDASYLGEDGDDYSGRSISGIGDINGDGYDDFAIGAYGDEEGGGANAGQTYVIFGKSTGWSMDTELGTSSDASFLGEDSSDYSGRSVSGIGDVNGDGYDDFAIGAYGDEEGGGASAGQTYIIFGKATGWAMDTGLASADASYLGEDGGDWSGFALSGAGDINGDGYDDFIIGAHVDEEMGANAGQTYVVLGKATGWAMDTDLTSADASFLGEDGGDRSGQSVSGIGDINGDGYDDFAIGAYDDEEGGSDAGQTYVIFGKPRQFDSVLARHVKAGDSVAIGDNIFINNETISADSQLYLDANMVTVQGGLNTLGNIGIGTTTPEHLFTVIGSGDNRIFFDSAKGAFRAGSVDSTQWDDANVGNASVAFGFNNIAAADYNAVFGGGNTALGDGDTLLGVGNTTVSSGFYNTAIGWGNTIRGNTPIAMVALGQNNIIDNGGLMTIGKFVSASSTDSIAIGKGFNGSNKGVNDIANTIMFFMGSSSPVMTLNDDQYVGIGTTTPTSELTVYGNILVEAPANTDRYINFGTATSSDGYGLRASSTGQMQIKNLGGSWTNIGAGATALNDLNDVILSSIISGDIVSYNGTNWVNLATSSLGFATTSHTHSGFQALNTELTGLSSLSTNGITVRTSSGNYTGRTLATSSNIITIVNADGISGNPTFDINEANLTLDNIGGTLSVGNGGTGATTFTSNGILYGNGTGAIQATAAGTNNYILYSNSGTPAWTNTPTLASLNVNGNITLSGTVDGVDLSTASSTWDSKWDELSDMTLATGNIYIGDGSNNPIATSSLYVDTNGNVGISSTSPSSKLTVEGDGYIGDELYIKGSRTTGDYSALILGQGTNSGGGMFTQRDGTSTKTTAFAGWDNGVNNRELYFGGGGWGARDPNFIYFYTDSNYGGNNDEGLLRMTIDNNGLVTIAQDLSVTGNITNGTWQADTIDVAYGGTGTSTLPNSGYLLMSNGSNYEFVASSSLGSASDLDGLTDVAITSADTGDIVYYNGSDWVDISTSSLGLLADLDIGATVQGYDADLNTIAGLSAGSDYFMVGNGSNWTTQGSTTVLTTLGLNIGSDIQAYDAGLASFDTVTDSAASGGIFYATAANTLANLAVGSEGDILSISSGVPTWIASNTVLMDAAFASNGIMVKRNSGDYVARTIVSTSSNEIEIEYGDGIDGNPAIGLPDVVYLGINGKLGRDAANLVDFSIDDQLMFRTNSTDQMIIDSSGNVGIGTTTPAAKLSVYSSLGAQLRLSYDDSNYADFTVDDTGQLTISSNGFQTTTMGSGDDAMIIDANGNIGIGTTTPSAMLTVGATSTNQFIVDLNGNITDGSWQADVISTTYGGTGISSVPLGYLLRGTGGTSLEATSTLFMTNNGNIGIGTTTPEGTFGITGAGTGDFGGYPTLFSIKGNDDQLWHTTFENLSYGANKGLAYYMGNAGEFSMWAYDGAQSTTTLTVNTATGNSGFGDGAGASEATPDAVLEVIGDFMVSATGNGDGDRFIVDASGNVGIGSTSPSAKLAVNGETISSYFTSDSATTNNFGGNINIANGMEYQINNATMLNFGEIGPNNNTTASGISIGNNNTSSGALAVAMGYSSQATGLLSVGVGYMATASGSNAVSLGNQIGNNSGNGGVSLGYQTNILSTGTGLFNIGSQNSIPVGLSNAGVIGSDMTLSGSDRLEVGVSDTAKMTILASGYFGVGTTSPSDKFVVGATSSNQFIVDENGNVTDGTWTGDLIGAQYGGLGIATNGSTGVPTVSGGTWSVNTSLPIGYGGTGTTTAPNAGYMLIGNSGGGYDYISSSSFVIDGNISGTGIVVKTAAGSYTSRTITGTANEITVTDGSGVSGNPTISLPDAVYLGANGQIGSGATNLIDFTNSEIAMQTGGVDAMVLDVNGNVMIGTSTVGSKLTVMSNTGSQLRLSYDANTYVDFTVASNGELSFSGSDDSGSVIYLGDNTAENIGMVFDGNANDYWMSVLDSDDSFRIGTSTTIGSSSVFTILNNGNVGINTSTPGAKLAIQGSLGIDILDIASSTGDSLFKILSNGRIGIGTSTPMGTTTMTISGSLYADEIYTSGSTFYMDNKPILSSTGGVLGMAAGSGDALNLTVNNGTNGLYIDTSGNVGLGTTTPSQMLHLSKAGDTAVGFEVRDVSSGTQTEGPNNASVFTQDTSIGGSGWLNHSNAQTSNDSVASAIVGLTTVSYYLTATGTSFSIPTNATIEGILVEVERRQNSSDGARDNSVKIIKNNTITGDEKADTVTEWPTSDGYASYGGASDLWGETWTADDINSGGFGFAIAASSTNTVTIYVDHIRFSVYYSVTKDINWAFGGDYSDGGKFKLSGSSTFGIGDLLAVDTSGNLGIGTTAPSAMLEIYKAGGSASDVMFEVSSSTGIGFKILGDGEAISDQAFNSAGADYAEYFYTVNNDLEAGEVVCVDIENENAVERCERGADGNVMGIVSTNPSIIGNYKEGYKENSNHVVIGMLGQVPAKVTTENGPIRPGDSLTSASQAGYIMRANPGDPTVGVALESLDADMITTTVETSSTTNEEISSYELNEDTIKVLISRRNKSLTVEMVESKITDRIAAMEIEDEVQILISQAVDNLELGDEIQTIVNDQLAALNSAIDSRLSIEFDSVNGQILNVAASVDDLIGRMSIAEGRIDDMLSNQASIIDQIAILNNQLGINATSTNDLVQNFQITNEGYIKMGNNIAQVAEEIISTSTEATSTENIISDEPSVAIVEIDAISDEIAAFVVNQEGEGDIADFRSKDVSVVNIENTGKVTIVGNMLVDGRIMVCSGGVCGNDLDSAVDETMGDIGVEGKVVAGAFEQVCEEGYIWVEGNSKYGTLPGFCVASDENCIEDSVASVNITQGEAALTCQEQGDGYHLVSENEWMTIADSIIRASDNDIDDIIEGLQLETASTATTSIEHVLTNGNKIYNFAGGVSEWTDQLTTRAELVEPVVNSWMEYYEVTNYHGYNIAPPYYYNSENGIGEIFIGTSTESNLRGFVRGENAIFDLDLSHSPVEATSTIGFRCAK